MRNPSIRTLFGSKKRVGSSLISTSEQSFYLVLLIDFSYLVINYARGDFIAQKCPVKGDLSRASNSF